MHDEHEDHESGDLTGAFGGADTLVARIDPRSFPTSTARAARTSPTDTHGAEVAVGSLPEHTESDGNPPEHPCRVPICSAPAGVMEYDLVRGVCRWCRAVVEEIDREIEGDLYRAFGVVQDRIQKEPSRG